MNTPTAVSHLTYQAVEIPDICHVPTEPKKNNSAECELQKINM